MRYILIFFYILSFSNLYAEQNSKEYIQYLQHLHIKTKKYRFFKLVLPLIQKHDHFLRTLYVQTKQDIQLNKNKKKILKLMSYYKTNNPQELLRRIKPHPMSITIAQAAIESAWGTSRFFVDAHNIFGIWSKSKSQKNTIEASKARKNGKHIHLVKYNSLEGSIKAYYLNIATNKAYKQFRINRFLINDPLELSAYLDQYSELGLIYTTRIIKVIISNKLQKYDLPAI